MPPRDPEPIDTREDTPPDEGGFDLFKPDSWGGTFLGDAFGQSQHDARRREDAARRTAQRLWGGAQQYAPSAGDLSRPYGYDPRDEGLQQVINSNGLTPGTQAAYAAMSQQAGQRAGAQRKAIAQQAQARGMGQSGAEYASELQAGQAGADTSAMGGYQAVAQGEQARNAAIGQQAGITAAQRANYAQAQSQGLQSVYDNYLRMIAGITGEYDNAQHAEQQRGAAAQQSGANIWGAVGKGVAGALGA